MEKYAREDIEKTLRGMIHNILRAAAESANQYFPLLGDDAFRIMLHEMADYVEVMKTVAPECLAPLSGFESTEASTDNNTLCRSPNDSVVLHKTRLSRSSKSRLNLMRNTPDLNETRVRSETSASPMEVDRNESHGNISAVLPIVEQSTFLDATCEMDESVNERGFLADVSDMNGTVRSRAPSFNIDSISPVASNYQPVPANCTFDYEHETPLFAKIMDQSSRNNAGLDATAAETSVICMNEITPKANKTIVIEDLTPMNIWNVSLRSGSNRKISEEIRREIQRQLEQDEQ